MTASHEATRFDDLAVTTPCCGAATSLNDLHYVLPAGFARFVLTARNAGKQLSAHEIADLEATLACRIRIVYTRR